MKKSLIISIFILTMLCLPIFPILADCTGIYSNRCDSVCNFFESQTCRCLDSTNSTNKNIGPGTKTCFGANSVDRDYNNQFCGKISDTQSGCFRTNYIDQSNSFYYCVDLTPNQACANFQSAGCQHTRSEITRQFSEGNTFITVQSGGNVYINGSQIEKTEAQRNYRNFISRGIGVYSRDLKKIPIGIIHMYGNDSDRDGLSDDFERAIGTDPYNFNTDKDRYSDKVEIIAGFNPNGAGRLAFNQNLVNKFKGKFLIQVEHAGELWYVNQNDGKRYFVGNEFDAMELIKAFKL